MSKSVTEKELAEKLAGIYGDINDYDWPTVARTAAELLGVPLADEKPEPGTWLDKRGRLVMVDGLHVMRIYNSHSSWFESAPHSDDYSEHVANLAGPARVVPAEPAELSEAEVGALWDANRDNAQWSWTSRGPAMWRMMTATVNAALAKHGHGRQVTREQVREQVEVAAKRTIMALSSTTIDNITDAVMALLEGSK